ncbi:zinc finger bed domain-containing protein 1-like protein [Lasius niger]|uniref:Zinc finger bed domain-containing protein 1-like protein n=1 Tax=Lasius niger TaxID=67767 RepID=A0A0J7NEJ0_LASNI|nr:zinc finger bed domain-containing protein 1-like protein [Lasius niger]
MHWEEENFDDPQPVKQKQSTLQNFLVPKSTDAQSQFQTSNSGNTSNYWDHLHRYHASKLKKSIEPEEEEESPSHSTPSGSEPEGGRVEIETENQCVQIQKNLSRKRSKDQPSLRKYIKKKRLYYGANSKQRITLDKTLVKFISRDLQPLSIVNDVGFKEFVYELNPRYSLPSRPTVTNVLIPKMYQEVKETISTILNTVKYLTITFDGWTSIAKQSYLTITGHFIFESKLQAALLNFIHVSDVSSTAENLKFLIQGKVLKVYPNVALVCAVTDNAANMIATCEKLKVKHIPCGAHSIQLVINHAILKTKPSSLLTASADTDIMKLFESDESENLVADHNEVSVYIILKKCKRITTFFHSSPKKSAELKKELNLRQMEITTLVQSVYTRWNSSYEMLQRIYKTLDCINIILLKSKNNIPLLNHEETECIPDILACLKIFSVMTEKLSGESYATISLLIPCTKQILIKLGNLESTIKTQAGQKFRKLLIKLSEDRLLQYETRTVPSIATVMDPRFKNLGFYQYTNFANAATSIKHELKTILNSLTTTINAQPTSDSSNESQKKG